MQALFSCNGQTHAVSEERRAPAGEDPAQTLRAADLGPGLKVAFVQVGVDLASTFDKVQRRHRRVCQALADDWSHDLINKQSETANERTKEKKGKEKKGRASIFSR